MKIPFEISYPPVNKGQFYVAFVVLLGLGGFLLWASFSTTYYHLIGALAGSALCLYGLNYLVESTRVGPTVASDIRRSAVYSVIFSLIIIFLYILFRFRRYQFSLGAIAALFHDVVIVLGIFSILGHLDFLPFSLEVDQAFIAAVLTIIGYSINDTVVVFDRIRENFGQMKSSHISNIFNISINQTLSRTLMTSVTTIITILILLIFAGDVIRGFMFALLVGIIVGTYSSIFVASPISHDLIRMSEGDTPQAPKKSGSSKKTNTAKKKS